MLPRRRHNPVGERRDIQLNAFACIGFALTVQRQVVGKFTGEHHRQHMGPAQSRAIGWKGAGGWVIASQDRQLHFSRTVWITFHCRGTTSRVSVMLSPSLVRLPPQHGQAAGPGTTTRSRGR